MADKTGETVAETDAASGETVAETDAASGETVAETDVASGETDEPVAEPGETSGNAGEPAAETDQTGPAAADADGPADAGPSDDEDAPGDPAPADTKSGPGASRARRAALVLGAAAVVLGGFGVLATVAAHNLNSSAAPQNIAVTDGAATSAVQHQIVHAVNTVFSYNYADTAATRQAAQSLLTGPAIRQYDTYFALVAKDAPAQKLVVTTRVTNSGVELLDGNQARLVVFANQQDTRAGTHQTSYAGALFAVTAVRQGGRWKIENIDTFSGQQ